MIRQAYRRSWFPCITGDRRRDLCEMARRGGRHVNWRRYCQCRVAEHSRRSVHSGRTGTTVTSAAPPGRRRPAQEVPEWPARPLCEPSRAPGRSFPASVRAGPQSCVHGPPAGRVLEFQSFDRQRQVSALVDPPHLGHSEDAVDIGPVGVTVGPLDFDHQLRRIGIKKMRRPDQTGPSCGPPGTSMRHRPGHSSHRLLPAGNPGGLQVVERTPTNGIDSACAA